MGNIMGFSDPITKTENASSESSRIKFGSSSVQGWRIDMEDAHVEILAVGGNEEISIFGVFDGHGGAEVANYAKEHAYRRILHHPLYSEGKYADAIQQAILELDQEMLVEENGDTTGRYDLSGSTAIVVLLHGNRLFCGNVGDSRAVASVAGNAVELSHDHKPSSPEEAMRITSAGGFIDGNRVNGNLALSRALGDFFFKRNEHKPFEDQVITSFPDVVEQELNGDWEFIVIACDGVWDVLTNAEVVEFVRERIADGMLPDQICQDLVLHCLAPDCTMGGLGCDNMTVQLICFVNGSSYVDLAAKCGKPASGEKPMSLSLKNHSWKDRKSKRLQPPGV